MARNITTTNYSWPNPDPNDKVNTANYWGTDLYTCIEGIDTELKAVSDLVPAAVPLGLLNVTLLSTQAITSGTSTTINLTGTNFSTGVYVFQTAGTYSVHGATSPLGGSSVTTGAYRTLRLTKNGTVIDTNQFNANSITSFRVGRCFTATAGETTSLQFYHNAGSICSLAAGDFTYLEIYRIG